MAVPRRWHWTKVVLFPLTPSSCAPSNVHCSNVAPSSVAPRRSEPSKWHWPNGRAFERGVAQVRVVEIALRERQPTEIDAPQVSPLEAALYLAAKDPASGGLAKIVDEPQSRREKRSTKRQDLTPAARPAIRTAEEGIVALAHRRLESPNED